MFDKEILNAIKNHAIAEYPRESCGLVVDDEYVPCTNAADDPECDFKIPTGEFAPLAARMQAIVHSHTNGRACPSKADMQSQIATAVPWGIVLTDGKTINDLFWFGDGAPVAPLEGRKFRHGVHDCYALVRDWFNVERGIVLPNFAREDEWWLRGENLLVELFTEAGFVAIERIEEPGDCVIGKVLGPVPNHCGVTVGDGLVLHHLSNRLSRKEPLNPWRKYVTHHLRYVGRKGKKRVRKKR